MKKRQIASLVLSLILIVPAVFASCSPTDESGDSEEDAADTPAVTTTDALSISGTELLFEPAGLRFRTSVEKGELYNSLVGDGSYSPGDDADKLSFGTLLCRTELLDGGVLTVQTAGAENYPLSAVDSQNDETFTYTAEVLLPDMSRPSLTQSYTAVAYATYTSDGVQVTEYSLPLEKSYYGTIKTAQLEGEEAAAAAAVVTVAESTLVNTDTVPVEATVSGFESIPAGYENGYIIQSTAQVQLEASSGSFNKYTVVYSSTQPMAGRVRYTSGGVEYTEKFYLEAGDAVEFSSFIDGFLDGRVGTGLYLYTFENLSNKPSMFTVHSLYSLTQTVPTEDIVYIQNDRFKAGASLRYGGALVWFEDFSDGRSSYTNLINTNDRGRYVQQSYYGTNAPPYEAGTYSGSAWAYNPVQGGDQYNNPSKLVDYSAANGVIYIKCRPLDWALNNVYTDCYMENTYTLYNNCLKVDNRLFDFYEYGHERSSHQELPAVYVLSALGNFSYYGGTAPWTGGSLTTKTDLGFWANSSSNYFNIESGNTETWCAWSDDSGYGMGVYTPGTEILLAGRFGYDGSADPSASSTNYVAALRTMFMPTFDAFEYSYLITAGSVTQMRSIFTANKNFVTEGVYVPADGSDSYSASGNYITTTDGLTAPNNNNYTAGPLVAVDDVGRVLQTSDTVGSVNTAKNVGLFYFLWLGEHGDYGIFDNQKIMDTYSDAATNTARWGPEQAMHFFSEPLYGYYKSNDVWVMRKHVEQLTNAGVDFLFIDCTNAYPYTSNMRSLMSILHEFNAQGWDAPKIVPYTHTSAAATVQTLYNEIYSSNYCSDTWFMLEGRPVIVSYESELSAELRSFFTVRESQWPNESKRTNGWPWMTFFKWSSNVFYNDSGEREVINISVAQHCGTIRFSDSGLYGDNTNRGRSYRYGTNHNDGSSYLYGYNFQSQWDEAIAENVPIVLVTSWNEWVAQRQPSSGSTIINFVDTFNIEYSRDCEMARGAYFDNYYMQLIYNIRRYKGVAPVLKQPQRSDSFMSDLSSWNSVQVTYRDFSGDTASRNARGFASTLYRNTTGRNDVTASKVCYDSTNVYFYVECAADINTSGSGTWLRLFLNTDNSTTGWYGYDYIVNYSKVSDTVTTVGAYSGTGNTFAFTQSAQVQYEVSGNKMMITVPRSAVGLTSSSLEFSFKWVDSTDTVTTMEQMYESGDAAPMGRLNYLFKST